MAEPEITGPEPPKRRRRWLRVATSVALVLVLAWALMPGGGSVGHFRSVAGRDAFMATYRRAMADMPSPSATLHLPTSYGVVRMYRFEGANPTEPPLVLLPGRAGASPIWAGNLPSLLAVRSVYTIDILGEAGASVQDTPITTGNDQARWLHEAITGLPEDQVHLLGVSFGGWTAMNLAIRQPAEVASVTVLDPVLTFSNLSLSVILRSIPASVPWSPKSWRDSFASWTAGGAPVEDVPVADMIESGMQNYALALPIPTRFTREQLQGVQMPVLVIMAGRSVMHDSADAARVAQQTLPRSTVRTYPTASHAINGEYPQQIAADVEELLLRTG